MKMWCLSAYLQGIQDVCDFVSLVEHKLILKSYELATS